MGGLREFTLPPARPLPVILLADVSGSMVGGKIETLNSAIRDMLRSFAEEDSHEIEIQVAIITFGHGGARVHQPLRPAADIQWKAMEAREKTPMGAAFTLVQQMLDDPDQLPGRAYAPTLVLISDGIPTDEWETPLDNLLGSRRAAKAARFAMAIGDDADVALLHRFLSDQQGRVFFAHEARAIRNFFRWVTLSVTHRSHSVDPNVIEPTEFDDFEF